MPTQRPFSSRLFSSKLKAQRGLNNTQCLYSKGHGKNVVSLNSLKIFLPNTREQRSESDKLANSFEINTIKPHILCSNEHLMKEQDPLHLTALE
jgi:hypothetical protein